MVPYFNIVAQTNENTVVTEYEPVKARSDSYQCEAALATDVVELHCDALPEAARARVTSPVSQATSTFQAASRRLSCTRALRTGLPSG